jgi:hypothetical protein
MMNHFQREIVLPLDSLSGAGEQAFSKGVVLQPSKKNTPSTEHKMLGNILFPIIGYLLIETVTIFPPASMNVVFRQLCALRFEVRR